MLNRKNETTINTNRNKKKIVFLISHCLGTQECKINKLVSRIHVFHIYVGLYLENCRVAETFVQMLRSLWLSL